MTDTDSFTRFYNEWYPRGVGAAQKLGLRRLEDAKDAAAKAMTAVQAAWGNIGTPEAYFQVVLKRRVIDQLRKNGRQRERETTLQEALDEVETPVAAEKLEAIATLNTPEQAFVARENQTDLARVLAMLPANYRISLYLESEGYSVHERAAYKEIPESTERTHTARARRRCMTLLAAIKPESKSDAVTSAEARRRERDELKAQRKKEGEEA